MNDNGDLGAVGTTGAVGSGMGAGAGAGTGTGAVGTGAVGAGMGAKGAGMGTGATVCGGGVGAPVGAGDGAADGASQTPGHAVSTSGQLSVPHPIESQKHRSGVASPTTPQYPGNEHCAVAHDKRASRRKVIEKRR